MEKKIIHGVSWKRIIEVLKATNDCNLCADITIEEDGNVIIDCCLSEKNFTNTNNGLWKK